MAVVRKRRVSVRKPMDFREWLTYAEDRGWIAPGVCQTHDIVPMNAAEEAEFEAGLDPCIPILRVWADKAMASMEG